MKRPIITDLNFLRQRSERVNPKEIKPLIKDLEDSLDLSKGCGLSAIQIGIKLRVAIVRLLNFRLNLYNPQIIEKTHPFRFVGEHCLSLPNLSVDTRRYNRIVVENGDGKKYSLKGIEAIVVQHEIAHLNGRTILDDKWKKRK